MSAHDLAAQPFTHPGVRHSQADLDLMKARILAEEQPWTSAYATMLAWPGWRDGKLGRTPSSLAFQPAPRTHIDVGSYESPRIGQDEAMTDATAAYIHAMQWTITGNTAHAEKVIEICNAWGNTLTTISGANKELAAAWIGSMFCEAAEIVRSTYTGAAPGAWASFDAMLRNRFYPVIQNFKPTFNGNWDALITQAMMSIGVVLDDRTIYNRARDYYLTGSGNGSLGNYCRTNGTTQETNRDQEHEQMGVLGLVNTAEIAWKQGEDLYGALNNRLLLALEGTAARCEAQNLTLFDGWDIAYNHYKHRMGLPTPNMDAYKATNRWSGAGWTRNTVGMWTLMTFRDLDPAPGTVATYAGGTLTNTAMANQTGIFTATFQAKSSAAPTNAFIGFSNGPQSALSGLACVVRFNVSGQIDALDGNSYTADNDISYAPGQTYTFRVVIDVPNRTYSVYVTPAGSAELVLGIGYSFRTEQNAITNLNNWSAFVEPQSLGGAGTLLVSNFTDGTEPPVPSEITIVSTADAFIRNGSYSGSNYGAEAILLVKASTSGFSRRSYLKFPVNALADASSVSLVLRLTALGTEGPSGHSFELREVSDDSWTENGVTWANQPATGNTILSRTLTSFEIGQDVVLDVTDYVRAQAAGNGIASFALVQSSDVNRGITFASREGLMAPRLIATFPVAPATYAEAALSFDWGNVPQDQRGPLDNPHGDRYNNFMKWALGGSFSEPEQANLAPVEMIDLGEGQLELRQSYHKAVPTLTYQAKWSTNLVDWYSQGVSAEQVDPATGFFYQSYTAPAGTVRVFIQLEVTEP